MMWVWSLGSSMKLEVVKKEMLTLQVSRFNQVQTRKKALPWKQDFSWRYHLRFCATHPASCVPRREPHLLFILHLSLSSALTAELWSLDISFRFDQRPRAKQDLAVLCGPFDSVLLPLQVYCSCLKQLSKFCAISMSCFETLLGWRAEINSFCSHHHSWPSNCALCPVGLTSRHPVVGRLEKMFDFQPLLSSDLPHTEFS